MNYLHDDAPPEDAAAPESPSDASPPPANVWATLALQAGALRDIADGCKLLGVPAPARLINLLLREMAYGIAGPDPLSEDFDWSQVPGGVRPVRGTPPADFAGYIVESRDCVGARYWHTDNAVTAGACHAAGYDVRAFPPGA